MACFQGIEISHTAVRTTAVPAEAYVRCHSGKRSSILGCGGIMLIWRLGATQCYRALVRQSRFPRRTSYLGEVHAHPRQQYFDRVVHCNPLPNIQEYGSFSLPTTQQRSAVCCSHRRYHLLAMAKTCERFVRNPPDRGCDRGDSADRSDSPPKLVS
jgi:hypothetical protein